MRTSSAPVTVRSGAASPASGRAVEIPTVTGTRSTPAQVQERSTAPGSRRTTATSSSTTRDYGPGRTRRQRQPELRQLLRAALRPEAWENLHTLLAGVWIGAPVAGVRPVRGGVAASPDGTDSR